MRSKFFKLFQVVLLVISPFAPGYYLKPVPSAKPMMPRGFQNSGRQAPPLSFRRAIP